MMSLYMTEILNDSMTDYCRSHFMTFASVLRIAIYDLMKKEKSLYSIIREDLKDNPHMERREKKTVQKCIALPEELIGELKEYCEKNKSRMSYTINIACVLYLQEQCWN